MPTDVPHIPDHELLRSIGRGSYGEVWLGRSVTGHYRAIKVVRRACFDHQRPYDREFAGIKKFEPVSRTHETQVDILHVGRNDAGGYFYYVMELADDQQSGPQIDPVNYTPRTLRSELQLHPGGLELQTCLEIGLHLTAALEHLHQNRLVHRDVKPSNIIFVNGVPKLADIGLVTSSDATRSFVGTEGYIPPEGPGTPQADLYSLGIVLYEMSTGRNRLDFPELPTHFKDATDQASRIQLNQLILKASDEDCKRRYPSAAVMQSDLLKLATGKRISTRRPGMIGRAQFLAGLAVVAVLLAGIKWLQFTATRMSVREASVLKVVSTNSHSPDLATTGTPAVNDPLQSGLVAWWKADGNALDSAGSNNGKLIEGAGYGVGKIGQAFSCNGTNDFISAPASSNWVLGTNDFSIALWVNFSSPFPSQAFLACEQGYGDVPKWVFRLRDGRLQWHMVFTNNPVDLSTPEFKPIIGQWYHLAMARSADRFYFYTNGVEFESTTWRGEVPRVNAPLTIGNAWGGFGITGLLDDIRFYRRALSTDEIKSFGLVNPPKTPDDDDVIVIGARRYQRSERMINTSFVGPNSPVQLAALANGNFVATWNQGLHWHSYAQIFDSQCNPVGSTVLLNVDEPTGWQWGATASPLPDSGFVAAWGDQIQNHTNGYTAVQRFDFRGKPTSPQLDAEIPGNWPTVATYTNGDFIVTGTEMVGENWVKDGPIWARRFSATIVPYGPAFQLGVLTNGYSSVSSSYGTDGRFAFAWASHTKNAMVRVYHSNEFSPFGPEFPANSDATCNGLVSARYNLSNELVVVWRSTQGGSFKNSVCVRRFDSKLKAKANEWKVNEEAPANHTGTSLCLGANNEALITWVSSANRISTNIYARLLDQAGNPIGHEFKVNQLAKGNHTTGWEACIHSAILGNGNFVVGWGGDGASGNGTYLTFFRLLQPESQALTPTN